MDWYHYQLAPKKHESWQMKSMMATHLFGALGTLLFIIGFCAAAWIGVEKLIAVAHNLRAPLVTNNPYFYIALTCMVIGSQLFLAGFLAELVSRSASDRNVYRIEKKI